MIRVSLYSIAQVIAHTGLSWSFNVNKARGFWFCTFGECKKGVCLSQTIGGGVDLSLSQAMNKAFSEYVERYAYRSDDFSKNHGFDSSGYSAFPKRMFNTKSYDVVRKHSFNEAVERYAILKFWHDFDIDYRTCQEDNFQLIFPILNDSILSVCIAIQDFGATGVAVGFSCNESIKKATCKAKSECISHAIASNLMLSGLHSDNDLYEKRLRYLISNGRHCYDDRLKHKGKKVIRLPKVEISREVKCKEFDSYCVHQIRLKGQDNFLDDRFVEVGYL